MRNGMSSVFEDPEFKEALKKYEGMVESHTPTYFDADELTDIAEYYAANDRYADAEAVIEFTLQLHPKDTDALIFRARSLVIQGNLEEAYKVMELIENKSDREVIYLKADLLIEENRFEEVDAIFNQLAIDENEKLSTLLDIITAYVSANQEKLAEKWVARLKEKGHDIVALREKNQYFRDVISDFYITFNKYALAIPLLNITLEHHPYSIEHWNDLGRCYLAKGNYADAHEALDFALAIDDKNVISLTFKAFCYRQTGRLNEACDYYLRLTKIDGHKIYAYLSLAKIAIEMGDYELAIEYMVPVEKKVGELSSYETSELYSSLAICHSALRNSELGFKYITQAIYLNDHDPEIRITAGRFYLMENDDEENALLQFEKALQFTTNDERFETLQNIASACFDLQKFRLSTQYYEQSVEEFPEDGRISYFFLLYAYFQLHELAPSLRYLAKIREDVPAMYANLGEDEALTSDKAFNAFVREVKDNVRNGKLDLNKYL